MGIIRYNIGKFRYSLQSERQRHPLKKYRHGQELIIPPYCKKLHLTLVNLPLILIASHEYAPWSEYTASGQVMTPKAWFPPCGVLVITHLSGTCPQFNLQTISGVGTPIAVQLMIKVCPISTTTLGGGLWMMIGPAEITKL